MIRLNAKKRWRKKHRKYVFREGCGNPIWIKMPTHMSTDVGQESLRLFREAQNEIMDAIQIAPNGDKITFGSLGARDFKNHWFKKPVMIVEVKQR